MSTKDDFLTGTKVTNDNQIYGTPNSKSKNGTGDSPNDQVRNKSQRNHWKKRIVEREAALLPSPILFFVNPA